MHGVQPMAKIAPSPNEASQPPREVTTRPPSLSPNEGVAVGAANEYNPHLFEEANTALSIQIFGNATSSFVAAQDRAWGAALTLVLVTFLATLAARAFTARIARKR